MECIKIYHNDKNEHTLIKQINDILNKRYELGILTKYEVKKATGNEF